MTAFSWDRFRVESLTTLRAVGPQTSGSITWCWLDSQELMPCPWPAVSESTCSSMKSTRVDHRNPLNSADAPSLNQTPLEDIPLLKCLPSAHLIQPLKMNIIQHPAPEKQQADILRERIHLSLQPQFHLDQGLKTHMLVRAKQAFPMSKTFR